MTNKEAIALIKSWRSEEYMSDLLVEAIDIAIKAVEHNEYPFYQEAYQTGYEEGKKENEHKKGKWDNKKIAFYWVCSECGAEVRSNIAEVYLTEHTLNFCPNCGADMRGDENEDKT